jgi:hypothetical protein
MNIERDLLQKITPFLSRNEYIAIVGPRQSGKTTFLEILRTYLRNELKISRDFIQTVTFEDRRLLAQFETDPVSFIQSYIPPPVTGRFYFMIDEFQYAVDGGQKLKLLYDTLKNIKIIITGSSSLDIKAHVGRHMVGRIVTFDLYPFNFREYLRAHDRRLERIYTEHNEQIVRRLFSGKALKVRQADPFGEELRHQYEKFCIWGGYPAVVLAGNAAIRRKLLADTYNNYILKDIKTLLELATEKNLLLLSQYLATQTGNIIVYQNLSQTAQLDHRQIKKHLNILEETYVCKEVRPFFTNRQKELTKNPKIFFMDMGFRNNLMENMNSLAMRSDAGAIVENTVFIRLSELYSQVHKINFWRTKAGAEVDFVIHAQDEFLPVEVKYSSLKSEKVSRSLASFIDTFKPACAVVLTKDFWGSVKKEKTRILYIPAYYL